MWEHNAEVNDLTWTKNNPVLAGTTEHPTRVVLTTLGAGLGPDTHCSTAAKPFSHRSATMRSVYVSQEHLYVVAGMVRL